MKLEVFNEKTYILTLVPCPGGVTQWTLHPTQEQKTRVRIPPGF
jgi:hypothetical protein